jgi:hypothetical protein
VGYWDGINAIHAQKTSRNCAKDNSGQVNASPRVAAISDPPYPQPEWKFQLEAEDLLRK